MQGTTPATAAKIEELPEPANNELLPQSQPSPRFDFRDVTAPVWSDAPPEAEKAQSQRTEPTTHSPGRHGEGPATVDSDFESLVKPLAATSSPDGNLGGRPFFQFTPPEPAGTAPSKQPPVSTAQPSQPEPPEAPASPLPNPALQNLQIRVGEDPARSVELQVSEHAGSVHVAVRSADPELTAPLRLNLPSLIENLERRGYRAESLSVHEAGPIGTTHSEQRSQPEQNESWTGSRNGGGNDSDARNRRKRKSEGPETPFSLSPVQEDKL
jgi:hypothetical protein